MEHVYQPTLDTESKDACKANTAETFSSHAWRDQAVAKALELEPWVCDASVNPNGAESPPHLECQQEKKSRSSDSAAGFGSTQELTMRTRGDGGFGSGMHSQSITNSQGLR